ncbi:hypothetical protein QTV43_000175 [Vibrio vulnificus]|nr:hypothetical protein [Vibrio vulnificus]
MMSLYFKQVILTTAALAVSGFSLSETVFEKALVAKPLVDEAELVKFVRSDTFNPYQKGGNGMTLLEIAEEKNLNETKAAIKSELTKFKRSEERRKIAAALDSGVLDALKDPESFLIELAYKGMFGEFKEVAKKHSIKDFNFMNKSGDTPLMAAQYTYYEESSRELTKWLVENGASTKFTSEVNPLVMACKLDNWRSVAILLAGGADPFQPINLKAVATSQNSTGCQVLIEKVILESNR